MIEHFSHLYQTDEDLIHFLSDRVLSQACSSAQSVLVQIYTANSQCQTVEVVAKTISQIVPDAIIVGASTVGEILAGELLTNQTVIGVTVFENSQIRAVSLPCTNGAENSCGRKLGELIEGRDEAIVGVLLLTTPLSIDVAEFVRGLDCATGHYPKFGGGAGDYAMMDNSLVYCHPNCHTKGAVAIVFSGDDLHLETATYLGWRPLSKSMEVTESDGLLVKQIDNRPAFEIYQRYLGIEGDKSFFLNALEFPFLLEREAGQIARVPVAVTEDGALQFVADVHEGETFRIGYGDLSLITQSARSIHRDMSQFDPQATFLFSCGCRRFLMQEGVNMETKPFEKLSPTFGFYTYGELFGTDSISVLNSTMVAVGLREGRARQVNSLQLDEDSGVSMDPYTNQHTRVVSRFMRFIEAVTDELEASHQEASRLAVTDHLTQLANRSRLDQVLDEHLSRAKRYQVPFSIISLDMDHFKSVNDTYGHQIGDQVLVRLAEILVENSRQVDIVGRWGGEEFLIIAPSMTLKQSISFAEKLREKIAATDFPMVGHKTVSVGVSNYSDGDTVDSLINRADTALYEAKNSGRNQVKHQ